ncbi:hypothetical protein [Legionella cincinnatiensis]|uniref:Uncharacterized protein n=1 Tax=Legionella cincinnatiensis TaxID=28085 RepID=A0A378IM04_9GAMM|nr:hypothetical protein [Legionella cincinnatiensis]KTC89300.1 hypothetical protein Lcin_1215 [Legionella cincinnatiensis]STX36277.1 Uncharacterised protein [Legionella cincinnatiensis]
MDDPFYSLKTALESAFHSVPMRNGKFTYPEIQHLKEACTNYNVEQKVTFIHLVKAIGAALPHFEKLRVNFEAVKISIDLMAATHQLPRVNWDKFLPHSKASARFPFNVLSVKQQDVELIPWLNTQSGKVFTQFASSEQTLVLIAHREHLGFSQKLRAHLEKDPEFLFRLIMKSESDFIKIANTRLILYLTDEQIASAIIKYLPNLLQEHPNTFTQVEQLVDKVNEILSNGRSISTLLRNTEAKSILERSEFFRIYQTDEYKNRQQPPLSAAEENHLKHKL